MSDFLGTTTTYFEKVVRNVAGYRNFKKTTSP
jgi:hypothetical protein